MNKRFLTIMVLPGDSSSPKRYSVSMKTIKTAKILGAISLVFLIYIVASYGSMSIKVRDLNRLKTENMSQKIELQALSSKVGDIETKMALLKNMDIKVRDMVSMGEPTGSGDIHNKPFGVGGASSKDEYFLTTKEKKDELATRMKDNLNQLELELDMQERSFTELHEFLMEQSSVLASTPSILPTRGWRTSSYGKRRDPFTGLRAMHKGLDVANRVGTSIIAPADGIVTRVTRKPSLGKLVEIKHGYGIKTRYAHLSKSKVRVGQKVKRGEQIALMGNTGRSTGTHLHYEVVVNGINVNPAKYVLN